MSDFEYKKSEQLRTILFVSKLLSLFFSVIPCFEYLFNGFNLNGHNSNYISYFTIVSVLAIMGIVLFLWMFIDKNRKTIKNFAFIEPFIFILIFTSTICFTGFDNSDYKYLFLFLIITYSIEHDMKYGITIASISSAIVIFIDLLFGDHTSVNLKFEKDLGLCTIFMISAWIIGFYARLEKRHINKLVNLVNVDGLTELFNHKYIHQTLRSLCDQNRQAGFIMMDIDYFKLYNDMFGHQQGDKALKLIATILKENIGENDIVGRYGGEEFAVILPDADIDIAYEMGEKLRRIIEETYIEGQEFLTPQNLTISVGVSILEKDCDDYESIINMADEALYKAKFLRKNCVERYSSLLSSINDKKSTDGNNLNTVKTLISVINSRDKYTYNHVQRVVRYCDIVADHLKLPSKDKRVLIYGAYMHDIGKINVDKKILINDKKLSDAQWVELRNHPKYGYDIITNFKSLEEISVLVLQHHERYDGKGYPNNLAKNQISYLSRILIIADSFDAMTTNRPYKKAMTFEQAFQELRDCSGTQFDPELTEKFISAITLEQLS